MSPEIVILIMVLSLFAVLSAGLPIAFAAGSIGIIFLLVLWGPEALIVAVTTALHSCSSFVLLAIPLFIMMGAVMERTGIAEDLYRGLYAWTAGLCSSSANRQQKQPQTISGQSQPIVPRV